MPAGEETPLEAVLERLARAPRDAEAWAHLYRQLWPFVLGLSRDYLGLSFPLAAAEDVAQEVFIRLARLAHFRPWELPQSQDALRTLLVVMTRNGCADYWRREHRQQRDVRRREPLLSAEAVAGVQSSGEAGVETQDLIDYLLARLDPHGQQVLRLFLEGFTAAQIGQRLGLSSRTVYRHQQRIRSLYQKATREEKADH